MAINPHFPDVAYNEKYQNLLYRLSIPGCEVKRGKKELGRVTHNVVLQIPII